MRALPLRTREAVARDTPAASATCWRVAGPVVAEGARDVDRCWDTPVTYRLRGCGESAFPQQRRTLMPRRTIGIAMNGVTGRMGYRQHLLRSILALREQGGLVLPDGTT